MSTSCTRTPDKLQPCKPEPPTKKGTSQQQKQARKENQLSPSIRFPLQWVSTTKIEQKQGQQYRESDHSSHHSWCVLQRKSTNWNQDAHTYIRSLHSYGYHQNKVTGINIRSLATPVDNNIRMKSWTAWYGLIGPSPHYNSGSTLIVKVNVNVTSIHFPSTKTTGYQLTILVSVSSSTATV